MAFEYPELRVGDDIEWASDPKASRWHYGKVTRLKTLSCDVVVFAEGQIAQFADCWHAEDPRCETEPTVVREPGRGVFRLTQREKELRAVYVGMDSLQRRLGGIEAMLDREALQEPGRGPGRPRKESVAL